MTITKRMIQDFAREHDCSIAEAIRTLKRQQDNDNRLRLFREINDAKTVDDLKGALLYCLGKLHD